MHQQDSLAFGLGNVDSEYFITTYINRPAPNGWARAEQLLYNIQHRLAVMLHSICEHIVLEKIHRDLQS